MLGNGNRQVGIASTVLALLLGASPARAVPGDADSVEAGVYVGQTMLDDYAGLEPDDDVLYGARLGSFMTPRWSFEFSWQRLGAENDSGTSLDVISYRGNALYNLMPGRRVRPFFTAGLGLETSEVGPRDTNDLGLNAGAGLRWFVSEHFGLRLDGRFVSTDVGAGVDEAQGNVEATIGALFGWGGGPPPDADGLPGHAARCGRGRAWLPARRRRRRRLGRARRLPRHRDGMPGG
jgi:hypothetical protein